MAESKKCEFHYGGQAIIEGVMMRGPKDFGVAVRRANGEIVTTQENVDSILGKFKWLKRPFLRGTFALIDSMALGMKALMYSADIAMKDVTAEEEKAKGIAELAVDKAEPAEKKSGGINDMTIGIVMVLGLLASLAIFFFIPIVAAKAVNGALKDYWSPSRLQLTILEGIIKIALFVGYILVVSRMKDIQRVFQYHGAEHKTINAYEAGEELTVENVQKYSKVHVRCGTSFILVVLVAGIVVFALVADHLPMGSLTNKGIASGFIRWGYKMCLLPFVAGISYEIIHFAGRFKDSFATKLLTFPGLLMQRITTREPEPAMIEVAIKSLECVLESERKESEAAAV